MDFATNTKISLPNRTIPQVNVKIPDTRIKTSVAHKAARYMDTLKRVFLVNDALIRVIIAMIMRTKGIPHSDEVDLSRSSLSDLATTVIISKMGTLNGRNRRIMKDAMIIMTTIAPLPHHHPLLRRHLE